MKDNRRYTNNEDTDDFIFDDEKDDIFEGEIEEIDINYEDENGDFVEDNTDADIEDELTEHLEDVEARVSRRKKHSFTFLIVVIIAILLGVIGVIVVIKTPSKTHVDMYSYYGIDNDGHSAKIMLNMEQTDGAALVYDGIYYVSNDYLCQNLTDKFYYDEDNGCVLYTTAEQIYEIPLDSSDYTIDGTADSKNYVIAIYKDQLYIAVDFVADKAAFTYTEYNDPYRLSIVLDGYEQTTVALTDKAVVREKATIKSDILWNNSDEAVVWGRVDEEDYNGWMKVITADGRCGYVKNKQAAATGGVVVFSSGYIAPEYASQVKDYKVTLVWHAVYSETDNDKIDELLENAGGITTVSPTWYQVLDASGAINSYADSDYVSYIHSIGMEIWPLVSDFISVDEEDGWDEKELLSNTQSRRNLIDNIIGEVITYGYDGINIDFEKVPKDAGADYTQFIRELSIKCRKNNIVFSIDNYVPRTYNAQYNRKAQGECADYVIVMGYDEHYSGSEEAGSVASIDFVTEGIDLTLNEVPANKVINGIPFYTRLWYKTTDESGNLVLDSKTYSMQGGLDIANELGLNIIWDDTVKQNVAQGVVDNTEYSIWLEDDDSMTARMEEIKARNIGGVAAWSLGLETDSVWNIISDNN